MSPSSAGGGGVGSGASAGTGGGGTIGSSSVSSSGSGSGEAFMLAEAVRSHESEYYSKQPSTYPFLFEFDSGSVHFADSYQVGQKSKSTSSVFLYTATHPSSSNTNQIVFL